MRTSRTVTAVGGVVVAAALIAFTNPKGVHAVTAALVQVTNTAANPVVTQGVVQQASQIVRLFCPPNQDCLKEDEDGEGGTAYTTPATGFLVINSVDVLPAACSSTHDASLEQPSFAAIEEWLVSGTVSTHITYPSGLVLRPGTSIRVFGSCVDDRFSLVGYLTPN